MSYQWVTYAAFGIMGTICLSLIALLIGAWFGDRRSLGGKLMIIGANTLLPAIGFMIWAGNWGYQYLPEWMDNEIQAIIFVSSCGLCATTFTIGFVLNRLNRIELPDRLPVVPPSAGSQEL